MYKVDLYWEDEQGARHYLGTSTTHADSKKEAKRHALDDCWPRDLEAPAAFDITRESDSPDDLNHYVLHSDCQATMRLTHIAEAKSKDKAREKVMDSLGDREDVTFVREKVTATSFLDFAETEEVSEKTAREVTDQKYTVVGTSANHPRGMTRIVSAESPEAAAEKVEEEYDAAVSAVFKGAHANQFSKT
jgi:ribosomal protein L20A (L18A)